MSDVYGPCLSVVIPCFNEESTIKTIIHRVLQQPVVVEVLVVDDGSTDRTREILASLHEDRVKIFLQPQNKGKGASLAFGLQKATGEYVVIQDADLEYNPEEYTKLLKPLIDGRADVVYGSRFLGGEEKRVLYFWHSMGNKFLTYCSNIMTNLNLTDMETCYKMFRREVIQSISLQESGFGIEPEITGKVAAKKCRIYEIGITYSGRTYEEGKKIGWKDGIRALYCIVRYAPFLVNRRG